MIVDEPSLLTRIRHRVTTAIDESFLWHNVVLGVLITLFVGLVYLFGWRP